MSLSWTVTTVADKAAAVAVVVTGNEADVAGEDAQDEGISLFTGKEELSTMTLTSLILPVILLPMSLRVSAVMEDVMYTITALDVVVDAVVVVVEEAEDIFKRSTPTTPATKDEDEADAELRMDLASDKVTTMMDPALAVVAAAAGVIKTVLRDSYPVPHWLLEFLWLL